MAGSPLLRDELSRAGVPPWAPYSADDLGTPRYYAWVTPSGEIEGTLVGDSNRMAVDELIQQCHVVRRGEQLRPAGQPPADLADPTALIVVYPGRIGHGSLSRSGKETRTLGELLDYAERELSGLRRRQ